jgi:hypothetical protein
MTSGDTSYWDDFFPQSLVPAVLTYVLATWDKIPKPGPSDLEPDITLKLYCALRQAKDRNFHPFLIRYEDMEIDTNLEKVNGRKDIVFFPSLQDEDIYLCLEAKRLNAIISGVKRSLADEYVKEGMQRFVDGKYARSVRHGAMLAYILDRDINRAMQNVENNIRGRLAELRMDDKSGFMASTILGHDPRAKETYHHRAGENSVFHIHHLFCS